MNCKLCGHPVHYNDCGPGSLPHADEPDYTAHDAEIVARIERLRKSSRHRYIENGAYIKSSWISVEDRNYNNGLTDAIAVVKEARRGINDDARMDTESG